MRHTARFFRTLFWRLRRRVFCPRGMHSFNPWTRESWHDKQGNFKFGRHCKHCGLWVTAGHPVREEKA